MWIPILVIQHFYIGTTPWDPIKYLIRYHILRSCEVLDENDRILWYSYLLHNLSVVWQALLLSCLLDSFTAPLHSPNGRHLPAVRAVQGDCEIVYQRSWLDHFTVPLHSPNDKHLPAVRAVQRYCYWGVENGGNSHWSCEPTMQGGTRQSQSIFRPTNHNRVMPANRRPCLIPTDSLTATRLGLCSSLISSCLPTFRWDRYLNAQCHSFQTSSELLIRCLILYWNDPTES